MVRAVAHRGPDGSAWETNGRHSYGAARLTISGDASAPAYYHHPERDVIVLLNGEIYNVGSLRANLTATGESVRTELETEVIARLYVRHGDAFVRKLKGMFAIAIFDGDRLLLARDRMGIKPLYYAWTGNTVAFGSEIKALLEVPGVPRNLDMQSLEEMYVFGYVCAADRTLLSSVHQVPPGCSVSFASGESRISRYWQPQPAHFHAANDLPYEEAVGQLHDSIVNAFDRVAVHGNHPLGIYLSGGLDSTILTLVLHRLLGHQVTTFSAYDEEDAPDFVAARRVAHALATNHVERRITLSDYMANLEHYTEHYECPLTGGVFDIHGGIAFHMLSETVADHEKVAMTGEGADELYGGYYWVYTHPLGFADRIRQRAGELPLSEHTKGFVSSLFPEPEDETVYRRNLFDALVGSGLANYHLLSVDRSGGAFGFEIRPAHLADDIVDFALSLPIEFKTPDAYTTKKVLRDAFRKDLEECGLGWVVERKKEGMPAAVRHVGAEALAILDERVTDSDYSNHPFRPYFGRKADAFLFRLFEERFLS